MDGYGNHKRGIVVVVVVVPGSVVVDIIHPGI